MLKLEQLKQYEIAKIYILKKLGYKVELPEGIKEEEYQLDRYYWAFKENFFRELRTNPITSRIENHKEQALNYLNRTFPYSLELGGYVPTNDLDEALELYAYHKGINVEETKIVPEYLKTIPLKRVYEEYERVLSQTEEVTSYIGVEEIKGSTVKAYQADNLYEVLQKLDDKNISNYISYLVMNSSNAMTNICGYRSEDGSYYVSEGNHRVLTQKALDEIDKLFGKQPFAIAPLKMTIQRNKFQSKGL